MTIVWLAAMVVCASWLVWFTWIYRRWVRGWNEMVDEYEARWGVEWTRDDGTIPAHRRRWKASREA